MKNSKNSNTVKSVKRGPGRPKYSPKFPRSLRFTFGQLCEVNGVDTRQTLANGKENPEYLKGENCTGLTLRKFLKRDKARKNKSNIVLLKGQFGKPDSESGLGKPPSLYCLRERLDEATIAAPVKATKKSPAKAKASPVTVPLTDTPAAPANDAVSTETKAYETLKNELLAPVPVVAISTPAPTPVETPQVGVDAELAENAVAAAEVAADAP